MLIVMILPNFVEDLKHLATSILFTPSVKIKSCYLTLALLNDTLISTQLIVDKKKEEELIWLLGSLIN